jgi:hypothetical protein
MSLSTRGHARARPTRAEGPICRRNVIASARPCTPGPPGNLHGKEGVDPGSRPGVARSRNILLVQRLPSSHRWAERPRHLLSAITKLATAEALPSRRSAYSLQNTRDGHLQVFHGASRTRTGDLLGAIQLPSHPESASYAALCSRAPGVPQHLPQQSAARLARAAGERLHRKGGVDGSSPAEGCAKVPQNGTFHIAETCTIPACGGYGAIYGAFRSET